MIRKSTRPFLWLGFLGVVIALAALAAPAQTDSQDKSEKEAAGQKELEKNTLKLLDEVASEANGLKLRENQSYVLTNAVLEEARA